MAEVNVKVAVRVRPLLPKEKLSGEQPCVKLIPTTNQLVLGKDRAFTFDHILSSKTSQDEMYHTCVESLVCSCFDGYNSTVFAYGQTGSGKTFTVGGDNITTQTEEDFGVIPRAIQQMYSIMQERNTREYTVKVSYIEIYKEEVRDLLAMETPSKDLHIREDEKGNTLISGTVEAECKTLEEVMACLEQGSSHRHTGSTQMNEHSSRSHSIFTVLIEQHWIDGENSEMLPKSCGRKQSEESEIIIEDLGDIEHYVCAKFHFVDLAGSERAHRTGNVGDRFKESVHINSGLLALGNVISALGDVKKKVKTTHIPYRDSKITRILKDSLGGNAKTLMICCISPASSSMDESLNALKYANRARNIKNKPIVNRDPQSLRFEEMQTEIRALREELQRQRTSLITANTDQETQSQTQLVQDMEQVKEMEDKVVKLQTECAHYRMVAEEAFKQMTDIQSRDILSQSQCVRLRDWLELMEEIKNQVPSTLNREAWENQTIVRLESELKQCKNDLRSDEEIFAEKSREVSQLMDNLTELEQTNGELSEQLEEARERIKQQGELLVEKEVKIEELLNKVKEMEQQQGLSLEVSRELDTRSEGPPTTTRRAKSVPVHMLGDRSARKESHDIRNIHTSPALFSLDRVMQGFRARSQLLVSRLEDNDEVLQREFSDSEPDSDNEQDVVDASPSTFHRNTKARGTYKVSKSKADEDTSGSDDLERSQTDDEKLMKVGTRLIRSKTMNRGPRPEISVSKADDSRLRDSADLKKKILKQSELQVRQSTQKLRDLSINIKMKEQLIRELVKSSKESQNMNKQYEGRIQTLEKEKQAAKQELTSLQKAFQDLEIREQQDRSDKDKLQSEFRRKMELAKTRIHSLQKRQKETERMASLTSQNDKRIHELEGAVDKMRQQQESLQRRLKEEVERKAKMERDMQREQQRVKELETRNEQQKKVLRVKTEEVSAMQRRLRSGSQAFMASEELGKLEEQRRWLDAEIDKVLDQRQQVEELQKELTRREDIVTKKEAMLAEKSELEIKKLRSSQVLSTDIRTVSSRLESVERKIQEKNLEMSQTPREERSSLHEELRILHHGKDKLQKQRKVLNCKLTEGALLSPQEERRLIELEEAIDALDAAIEYKNQTISGRQHDIRRSVLLLRSEEHVMSKLRSLTAEETRTLLTRYFEKVIDLKEGERKQELRCSELEMKIEEQQQLTREMESSLQRAGMEADRRLTLQQQQYESKIQMMMRQLMEAEARGGATSTDIMAQKQKLEKDLYYYKKTCHDLKRKMRELTGVSASNNHSASGDHAAMDSDVIHAATPRDTPRSPRDNRTTPSKSPRVSSTQSRQSTTTYIINQDRAGSQAASMDHHSVSASGSQQADRAMYMRDSHTPVRISRRELRRMSTEEVSLRMSAVSGVGDAALPADSLDSNDTLN